MNYVQYVYLSWVQATLDRLHVGTCFIANVLMHGARINLVALCAGNLYKKQISTTNKQHLKTYLILLFTRTYWTDFTIHLLSMITFNEVFIKLIMALIL